MLARIAIRAASSLQTYISTQAVQGAHKLPTVCRVVLSTYFQTPNNRRGLRTSQTLKTETYYSDSHEWLRVDGDTGTIGITDHAQEKLGDIVFVELPEVGAVWERNDIFAVIESVKAASDLMMPVTGEITAANEALVENPELVNSSATKEGWIAKVKLNDTSELNNLMDKKAYDEMVSSDKSE